MPTASSLPRVVVSAAGPCTSRTACRPTITTSWAWSVTTVTGTEKLKGGKYTLRFEFAYDGGGFGKGGMGTLYVNDKKVAEGRIERTQPMIFSADETADVGIDLATPVVESIGAEARSRFNGRIQKVTITVE
jgi:hypothetical protein